MPYKKSYRRKSSRRRRGKRSYRGVGAPIGRRPPMTRALRVQQNLTRDCRWFKRIWEVVTVSDSAGKFNYVFQPSDVTGCLDFLKWGQCWEQFKVLSFAIRLLPVAVGSESLIKSSGGPGPVTLTPLYLRGNTITYLDQGESDPVPPTLGDMIVRPSARLVASRRPHKRWASRPQGNPEWGDFEPDGTIGSLDDWTDTRIRLYGEGFSVPDDPTAQLRYFYVTEYFKVLFRGRQQFTPSP